MTSAQRVKIAVRFYNEMEAPDPRDWECLFRALEEHNDDWLRAVETIMDTKPVEAMPVMKEN